jgi:hypothetical protein
VKNSLRLSILLSLMSLLIAPVACVDSFTDSALENTKQEKLIVDGLITTDLKKFSVTLTTSIAPLGKKTPDVIAYAKVKIIDDLKQEVELFHTSYGIYESKTEQKVAVGRAYKVMIELPNGEKYESSPELVKAAPPIESLNYEFVENNNLGGYKLPSFEVTAQIQDDAKSVNFYRLDWEHYQYLTSCRDRIDNDFNYLVRTNCCEPCWFIKKSYGLISLIDDGLFNGKKINQLVTNVPYNSRRPFYIQVNLYATTEAAYRYWKNVKAQINNVGGVFDSPPSIIQGNVKNVNHPEEQVLGFFGASSISRKQTYVLRSKAPYPPVIPKLAKRAVIDRTCIPCKEGVIRTLQKPIGWNDDYNTIFYDPLEEL